jgi:hypothetical protein
VAVSRMRSQPLNYFSSIMSAWRAPASFFLLWIIDYNLGPSLFPYVIDFLNYSSYLTRNLESTRRLKDPDIQNSDDAIVGLRDERPGHGLRKIQNSLRE